MAKLKALCVTTDDTGSSILYVHQKPSVLPRCGYNDSDFIPASIEDEVYVNDHDIMIKRKCLNRKSHILIATDLSMFSLLRHQILTSYKGQGQF